jgi:hypothetical protein
MEEQKKRKLGKNVFLELLLLLRVDLWHDGGHNFSLDSRLSGDYVYTEKQQIVFTCCLKDKPPFGCFQIFQIMDIVTVTSGSMTFIILALYCFLSIVPRYNYFLAIVILGASSLIRCS